MFPSKHLTFQYDWNLEREWIDASRPIKMITLIWTFDHLLSLHILVSVTVIHKNIYVNFLVYKQFWVVQLPISH